jgi:hypothetical protein
MAEAETALTQRNPPGIGVVLSAAAAFLSQRDRQVVDYVWDGLLAGTEPARCSTSLERRASPRRRTR